MKKLVYAAALFSATAAYSNTSDIDGLLNKVQTQHVSEDNVNKERLDEFSAKVKEQQKMLNKAMADLKSEQKKADALRVEFEKGESSLAELEKKLDITMGTLGEMYGVVRQVAADSYASFENSIISFNHTDRLEFLKTLSGKKELASTDQLKRLWYELLNDMNQSGKVVKFTSNVTSMNGVSESTEITRVGSFNLISGENYLYYLPETNEIATLKRQPAGAMTGTLKDFANSSDAFTTLAIDPTKGVLLSKMVNAPTLSERVEQGGIVGYVILGVLLIGIMLVLERMFRLKDIAKKIELQLKSSDVLKGNPLGKILSVYNQNKDHDVDSLEIKLHEAILKTTAPLDKGIGTVKILAAVAPLLGLLGTVTGMIGTFQSITLFGTGDPKLMAGGISQALVTTVLGLVAAIPLILLHSLIASKSKKVNAILEEQAAGLLVERIEAKEA